LLPSAPSSPEPVLAPSSPVCPFCKGAVSADTLRFGGNCPHCMLEIPGEEAPTDPGVQARQRQEQEDRARRAAQQKKSRVLGVVAFLALVGLGAGGYQVWQSNQAAMTYEMDDFYVMPLEEIQGPPQAAAVDPAAASAAGTPGTPRDAKAGATGRKPSTNLPVAQNDRPATDGGPLKASTGGGSTGDVAPASMSTALPTGGTSLGGGAIKVGQVGSDAVLTDEAAIYDMAKRVITGLSPQVQNCYNQRLKQVEGLKGAWEVSFTIGRDGATKGVRVNGVNGADSELETCITRAVSAWQFQKIVKDQPVKRTYRFGPSSW